MSQLPVTTTTTYTTTNVASPGGRRQHYNDQLACQSMFLGATQIVIGLVSIIFWSLAVYCDRKYRHWRDANLFTFILTGIWCGAFFCLPGAFGIIAAKRRTKCPIIAFMVLSGFSMFLLAPFYAFCSIGYAILSFADNLNQGLLASTAICAFVSVLYLFVVLWSFIIGCIGTCCPQQTRSGHVYQPTQAVYIQEGSVVQPAPALVQYPQQPMGQGASYPRQAAYPQQQPTTYGYPPQKI